MVLFLAGLGVLLYPTVSNWLYRSSVAQQKEQFIQQVEAAAEPQPTASLEEPEPVLPFEPLYQELCRRNASLYAERQKDLKDPFSYQQLDIDLTAYGLEGNVIGFLSIPKMDVELPILLGPTRTCGRAPCI